MLTLSCNLTGKNEKVEIDREFALYTFVRITTFLLNS